jgi:hypothetical protein
LTREEARRALTPLRPPPDLSEIMGRSFSKRFRRYLRNMLSEYKRFAIYAKY